jgi:hypothetical protein
MEVGKGEPEPPPNLQPAMTRTQQLQAFTVRQLRIYSRKQGVAILQKWNKSELITAILAAGK